MSPRVHARLGTAAATAPDWPAVVVVVSAVLHRKDETVVVVVIEQRAKSIDCENEYDYDYDNDNEDENEDAFRVQKRDKRFEFYGGRCRMPVSGCRIGKARFAPLSSG